MICRLFGYLKLGMLARKFIFLLLLQAPLFMHGEGVHFVREILPIFKDRCIECHQTPFEKNGRLIKPKAGLRMDGLAHLMFGSDEGPVLVPNHPSKSPLYNRVSLPADDDDRMPPKGDPLTGEQLDLIRQWIGQGADFGTWRGATDGLDQLVRKDPSELARVPKFVSFYQAMGQDLKPVSSELISQTRKTTGLLIRPIGKGSSLLEVRVVTRHGRVKDSTLELLLPLAGAIVKLDLRETMITDDACRIIAEFTNLVELNLRECQIGNKGALRFVELSKLQTLNLGSTSVTKEVLSPLLKLPALKCLNVWQTQAGAETINSSSVRSGLTLVK